MKSAIASLEIYAFATEGASDGAAPIGLARSDAGRPRRLSLVIGAPERAPTGDAWHCRVVLADLHRPQTLAGRDSMEALLRAVGRARAWLDALRAEGLLLYRDRAGLEPLELP